MRHVVYQRTHAPQHHQVAIAYIATTWLNFDADLLRFHGVLPADIDDDPCLTVRATNFEGVWTEGRFRLRHH